MMDIPRDISSEDKLLKHSFLLFSPTCDRVLHARLTLVKIDPRTRISRAILLSSDRRAIVKLIPADSGESRPDSMARLRSHRKAGVIGIARESVTGL